MKLPGGGQSPRTPPKAEPEPSLGPEQEAAHGLCTHTYTELSPHATGAYTAPLSCPLLSPPTPTHTSQPRPESLAHGPRACLTTTYLAHGRLHTLEPPFSLPVVLGKGRRGNLILEMRGQRLSLGVRHCPRRNYGRRHPELGGLPLQGPGAVDEGCTEPLPLPCPGPATHSLTGGGTKTCQQLSVLPVEGPISLPCLPTPTWSTWGAPPNFLTPPFAPALGSPHISAFSRSLVPWVSQSYIL